jgi:hypothetical protein
MSIALDACPLCRSSELSGSFHTQQIRDLFDIKSQAMTIALCETCGFVFQNPLLPSLADTTHYEEHSSYVTLPSPQFEIAKRDQFAWIKSVARSSGFEALLAHRTRATGLYEIGASVGALLAVAKADGWPVSGLEPSPAAVRVASDAYQIAIRQGDLRALDQIELPIVTRIHVLEHIPDPVAALAHLHRIAPSSSLLTIEVPDFSHPRNTGGTGYFVPEHVSYFTADSLVRAATAAGWSTADVHVHEYSDAPEFCMYPVLRGSFLKLTRDDRILLRGLARDLTTSYVENQANVLREKLRTFARQHSSIVLFGGGWHTLMLLELCSPQERAQIKAILDSNPDRAGSEIEGIKIEHSANLPSYRGAGIVVSSQGYQEQIVEQIRASVGDACPILTFY